MNTKQISNTKAIKHSRQIRTLLPVILTFLLIPIILRGVTVKTYLSNYEWYSKATKTVDVFLYSKSTLFIILSIGMFIILIYSIWKQLKIKTGVQFKSLLLEEKSFIPLLIYLLLTIVSTIFSDHASFAMHGMVGQFEPLWVLLGYGIVAYYTYRFVNSSYQIQVLITTFIIAITIVTIIGVGQYFEHDFFQTSFGKSLISKNELTFRFAPRHVYSTLYNPNYVGLFVALVIPLLAILMFYTRSVLKKVLYTILFIGALICGYGSNSTSGIIGIVTGLTLLCIFIATATYQSWKQHRIKVLIGVFVLVFTMFTVNQVEGNPIGKKISQAFELVMNDSAQPRSKLSSIETSDTQVTLGYNSDKLNIQFINDNGAYDFKFFDHSGNELPFTIDASGEYLMLQDDTYSGMVFSLVNFDDYIAFQIKTDDMSWYFTNQTDGTYYLINKFGKLLKINQQQEFKSYWTFGSGRGYIWEKTLPLIKEFPLLGTGPDTFALYFPNTEYLNLYHAGFIDEIVTKPHSLYLQIAAQTGIPSLVAFLIFFIMYLVSSIRVFYQYSFKSYEAKIGIGILAGTCGYMISSLTNDSTITVAPVFWALIGLGLAINRMIKKKF